MNAVVPLQAEDGPLVALDLEQQVIGGILANNAAFQRIQAFLQPEHFGDARHAEIYACAKAMMEAGKPATPPALASYMAATDSLAAIGGAAYLARIITGLTSPAFVEDYARMLLDLAVRRQALVQLRTTADSLKRADFNEAAAGLLAKAATALDELASAGTAPMAVSVGDAAADAVEATTDIVTHGVVPQIVPTGFEDMDRIMDGFDPGSYTIIGARPSMGKAQPLDAKILMADGTFKEMGALRLGDALASVDGAASRVAGIFPQGERDVFRVTFSDGRSTLACGEHLWRVGNRKWEEDQVLSTRDLIELLRKPSFVNRVYIPTVSGHFGHDEALPIDPWLLGALIANGSLARGTPQFSTGDATTLWAVQEKVAAAGGAVTRSPGNHYDFRIKAAGERNEIAHALGAMGLRGKRSHEKAIPPQYLAANRQARIELLRGLMDTDGYVEKNGAVRYSSCSEQLARDVRDLVRSLGGNCEIVPKTPHYTYLGERREGRPHFICNIRFSQPREFIGLLRKQRRAPEFNEVRLNIASIESVGVKLVQCIAVTHPSHLYVTDDYVVTHNTAFAQWLAYNAANAGFGVAFFSIEMAQRRLVERWLSGLSGIPASAIKTGRISEGQFKRPLNEREMAKLEEAREQLTRLPIALDLNPRPTVPDIIAGIRKMRREKKPVDLVVVDYLGLVRCAERMRSRYEEVTQISAELKAAAKTLGLPFVVLAQLSRANESRDDKRPSLSDLRDSGAIEQDADIVMFLHREHYYLARNPPKPRTGEEPHDFSLREQQHEAECAEHAGRAELNIAKNRNGGLGLVDLAFTDHLTRFSSLARGEQR